MTPEQREILYLVAHGDRYVISDQDRIAIRAALERIGKLEACLRGFVTSDCADEIEGYETKARALLAEGKTT